MEKIKKFIQKPIALGIAGLLAGLIIGLIVLGWGLWPLQWVDAAPADLQIDYQRDYLCMVIDSYGRNKNNELVQLRWQGLGNKSADLLSTLTPAVCGFTSDKEIKSFGTLVNAIATVGEIENVGSDSVNPLEPEPDDNGKISLMPLAILMLLTLIVGAIFIFLLIRRNKMSGNNQAKNKKNKVPIQSDGPMEETRGEKTTLEEPPLAQFMSTYRQGDDLYDDSFSIDSINGEFLGECGVGIAETIGVGEPKKVTALEVWLFDKNDIQTVTKVLLSEHANNDPAIRQRLLSKGEPITVEPGMRFLMETASLQLEAKVVDMVYARGPLPENSYFSRLILEIAVWPK